MFITSTQNCSPKYTCMEDRQREKQMDKMQKTKQHQPSNSHTQGDSTFIRELKSSSCNTWLPSIMALSRDKRNNPQARLCPWLTWNSRTVYKQSRLNPEKSPSVFASLPQQIRAIHLVAQARILLQSQWIYFPVISQIHSFLLILISTACLSCHHPAYYKSSEKTPCMRVFSDRFSPNVLNQNLITFQQTSMPCKALSGQHLEHNSPYPA